jgi:fluoride ion exporter CrcB/FEX
VRGVASSRISARMGFYSALVGLLSTFSVLTVELVLTAVKKELHSANSSKSVSLCYSLNDTVIYIDAEALPRS